MLTQFRDLAAFDLKAFLNIPHTEASCTMMTLASSAHSILSESRTISRPLYYVKKLIK